MNSASTRICPAALIHALAALAVAFLVTFAASVPAQAKVTAMKQAIAEAAARILVIRPSGS